MTGPGTASLVRGRMEMVLDWRNRAAIAKVRTRCGGEVICGAYCRHGGNSAPSSILQHCRVEIGTFVAELRRHDNVSARPRA
jgi:hypothetical protein